LSPDTWGEAKVSAIEIQSGRASEEDRVLTWRREELTRAGYDESIAEMLSALRYVDLHLATELLRRGCPADTALKILV
jgi:hypothetical protein